MPPRLPLVAALLLVWTAVPHASQAPTDAAAEPAEVAVDPIRCWWRTDRPAVHIGERFLVTLTCRVVETAEVTVTPVLMQLEPGAVLVTPFESVGGRRHEDVVAPPYRYLQFEYVVRFMGEGGFGTDVAIPALTVPYTVQAAAGGGAQGREQRYVLPAIPVRIVSLAPAGATDIRDASSDTFAGVQADRFRSAAALVTAGFLFALAAVLVGVAGVKAATARRKTARAAKPASTTAVLQGCLGALRQVKADAARDGWSPALARRAAAMFRIAGATAIGRPVAQSPAARGAAEADGQVLLRAGLMRPRRVLVSAPTTPVALAHHLDNGSAASPRMRAVVEPIHGALQAFSVQAYARNGTPDAASLDAALDEGMRAVRKLQMYGLWTRSRPAAVGPSVRP